ncbi:uncharacterized protein LOC119227414 [Pungitius pungitius]|uniref:uncharacterized protein LOC119227414 n=1 Tax=Pungitius pungitius TaxID=134920 RepID=UPI002E11D8B2
MEFGEHAKSFTLPFQTTARLPQDATVEWRRSGPQSMMVHMFKDGQNQPDEQDRYYHGRTKMRDNPLQSRDLSLTIRIYGNKDSGTYTCTVHRDGDILAQRVVENRFKASCVTVEVDKWVKTVKLPWKYTADLPEDASVEWCSWVIVHLYQNGKDQPERQDQIFRGRTNMDKDPLRSGDLSLTLTNLTEGDFGIYSCNVFTDKDIIWNRIVLLQAKGHKMKM